MRKRAKELISELDVKPHPEGGYFREIFRSKHKVQPLDERSARSALTTIYFLLTKGQYGRWHWVASDEVWHFYEGDPLELYWIDQRDVGTSRSARNRHFQTFVQCAWFPLDVGKRQGLSESLASWELTSLPDSNLKISTCFLRVTSARTHQVA
jgi:hypothetical protein